MATKKKNLKGKRKQNTKKNSKNKRIREYLINKSMPEFMSQNSKEHDLERFLKFTDFYKQNENLFKNLSDNELETVVGIFSMKISEVREQEIGIETFISNLISAIQTEETEEQLESWIINDSEKVRYFGIEPDYSVKSLKQLGAFLWKESRNFKNDSLKATQVIMTSAAYFGEVIRKDSQKNFKWLSYEEAVKNGLKDGQNYFNSFVLYTEPDIFILPIYSIYTVVHGENSSNHLKIVYEAVISKYK